MLMSNFKLFAQRLFANVPPLKKQKRIANVMYMHFNNSYYKKVTSAKTQLETKRKLNVQNKSHCIGDTWTSLCLMDSQLGNSNNVNLLDF